METKNIGNNNNKIFSKIKKPSQKPSQHASPTPIKIYFPTISLDKIKDIVKQNNKKENNKKENKTNISQYLTEENKKIIIYGLTGIFEMVNNNLYQIYPIDRSVKELNIHNNFKVLIDSSYMRRNHDPSYQIPYYHSIKNKIIRTYKSDVKSNIKFIIEMENDDVSDFYVMITSADIINNEKNEIEINKFIKDEIMSFLLRLNLYR
jgi:hypothetical protein